MKKRLFTIMAALSMLACLIGIAQWLRHNDWDASWSWEIGYGTRPLTKAELATPSFRFSQWNMKLAGAQVGSEVAILFSAHVSDEDRAKLPGHGVLKGEPSFALEALYSRTGRGLELLVVKFPYWLLVLLTAILPAWWTMHFRREKIRETRALKGECRNCGYDMRASPQRCPECGAVAEKAPA